MSIDVEFEGWGIQEVREYAIARLNVWQEHVDPCEHGHVDHTEADHLGRRLVHAMAGGFGADWDYDEAVAYIQAADAIAPAARLHVATGHALAARSPEGRWVAFATKALP